jgi:outer membrane protein assembly factor BamA
MSYHHFFAMKALSLSLVLLVAALSAGAQEKKPDTGPVKLKAIRVKGSRLPDVSLSRLTGLQAGQTVDEAKVRGALEHANASGLFKNISYSYEYDAVDQAEATLEFEVTDEPNLLPVTIKIPKVSGEDVWKYLQGVDPLFTREMPITAKAIELYSRYITKYLQTLGRSDIVIGNVVGTDNHPSGVEFVPGKLHVKGR